jgi:hypothetical protein
MKFWVNVFNSLKFNVYNTIISFFAKRTFQRRLICFKGGGSISHSVCEYYPGAFVSNNAFS